MSNNYASYYTLSPSSMQGNNYVQSQTVGPLSTSQTPGAIRYHSYGALPGKHPNPPKYYPSDFGSEFSQNRFQYSQCDTSWKQQALAREKLIASNRAYHYMSKSTQKQWPTESGHMNYITPISSSMRTSILKRGSIGKSSYKQGLPDKDFLTYKSYDKSFVHTRLQRARSQGCVAPAKKGSIYNKTCTAGGGICTSGSIVGQGY